MEASARGRTFGRYVVLEKLGAGGMGVVYAAWDQTLDRKVALKLIHGDRIRTEARRAKAIERLVNEARALAKLDHPNVVRVIEINSDNEQVFIAMEYVDGLTLRKWLATKQRRWDEIANVFAAAGEGLAAAHSVDMVHGDFKPDNVIVTLSGVVKVLDFGLARGFDSPSEGGGFETPSKDIKAVSAGLLRSASGSASGSDSDSDSVEDTVVGGAGHEDFTRSSGAVDGNDHARTRAATALSGTLAYMSPEHFTGGRPSFATDQFAFCIAMFEALYGERPFQGETATKLSMNIVDGGIRIPKHPPRRLPSFLRRAVLRGLNAEPAARFPSMKLLVSEVGRRPAKRAFKIISIIGSGAIAVSLGMVIQHRMSPSAACSDLVRQIDDVTNTEFVVEVVRRVAEGKRAPMKKVAEIIEQRLDGIVERWRSAAQTSCDDLNVRGSISLEEYEMRVRCLDQTRQRLEMYLDTFHDAPESAVMGATEVLRELPDPSICLHAERSQTGEFARADEQTKAIRDELFELQTAYLHGDFKRVEDRLIPFLKEVESLENRQIYSQVIYLQGLIVSWRGRNPGDAALVWNEASLAADRARDDHLRLKVEFERADIHTAIDEYDEAEMALDRAAAIASRLELKRTYAWDVIEHQRGFIQMRRGDYKGAQETLRKVWEKVQHDPNAWEVQRDVGTLLGLMARDTGHSIEALAYTQRACDLIASNMTPFHPDNTSCQLNLGSIYATMKRYEEAHAVYDEIIERYSEENYDSKGNLNLAFVYTLKALAFAEVRQLDAAVPLHRLALREYKQLGRLDTADEALELDNMGLTLLLLGRLDEADEALSRSLRVWTAASGAGHADLSYPLNHLALLAVLRGNLSDARDKYAQARALREAYPQDETDTSLLDFVGALATYGEDPKGAVKLADRAVDRLGEHKGGGHFAALERWRLVPVAPKVGSSNVEILTD